MICSWLRKDNQADWRGQASVRVPSHYSTCVLLKAGCLQSMALYSRSAVLRQVYVSICTRQLIKLYEDDTLQDIYLLEI